ncbi:kinase-like protein [Corynespora cassiicola Philippines]|uniref:non-specific serine/threonine protein kinase n=1 Tax=Corynespora cassiicola Philippines TaxID=1448308 RepID=A0A2T2NY84_CORCC|nr:kinase-like protein [Corynespora cassiicola Philippines]
MEKKMEQLREASAGASCVSAANTFFKTFYSFWVDSRMFQLECYSISTNEGEFGIPKSVKSFRKSLKYMQMLGMPWSIWRSIKDFWERKGGIKVEIIFVETSVCAKDAFKETELVQTLEEWKDRPIAKANAIKTLKTAPWDSRSNPYFHCELQLYFLSFEIRKRQGYEMHQFIGCSKLSCYACWKVLEATEYRTRAAHHKVYPDCVFPFPRPKDRETEGYKEFVQIFKDLQSLMTNDIDLYGRTRSVHAIEQTQPAHTDASCNFDPGVAREQLQLIKARNFANEGFPYEIIESEGKFVGTYEQVYAAHTTLDASKPKPPGSVPSAYYAVKEIRMRSDNHFRRVCTEVTILKELKHDNILRYHETLYNDQKLGVIYLVTRPWAPVTLQDVLLHKREHVWWYSPKNLNPWPAIVKECLEGLTYLHAKESTRKEIKHKDLKPSNILLQEVPHPDGPFGEEGASFCVRPIIADFGLSKKFVPNGGTDNMGTTPFKAPEQGVNDSGNSVSLLESDVWSLGCCFALILALVYSGPNAFEELWKITVTADQTFQHNLEALREIFKDTYDDSDLSVTERNSREVFRKSLYQLVFDMLREKPKTRTTPQQALKTMEEVEAHILIIRLQLPPIYLWTEKNSSELIDMNDPPTWSELLDRSHAFLVQNQSLPQRWLYSLVRVIRVEKQYMFRFRFFLGAPLEEVGSQIILREDLSSLPSKDWVSSAEMYSRLQEQCQKHGHPSSVSLYLSRDSDWIVEFGRVLFCLIIIVHICVSLFNEISTSGTTDQNEKKVEQPSVIVFVLLACIVALSVIRTVRHPQVV